MSNEEVIYLTPTDLQFTSASPERIRPGGTQRPGKSEGRGIRLSIWIHWVLMNCQTLKVKKKVFICTAGSLMVIPNHKEGSSRTIFF